MKTVTFKKMEYTHYIILQNVIAKFRAEKLNGMDIEIYNDVYFNNMLAVDITTNLFFRFRTKIENQSFGTFKLKIHEAIILLQCCNDFKGQDDYVNVTVRKYSDEIHKQLINL